MIEKLGRPDLDLPHNDTDKKLVYKQLQLTVEVDLRGTPDDIAPGGAPKPGAQGPTVWAVGTGAVDEATRFGGEYDGSIHGIRHGEDIDSVTAKWGMGGEPGPYDPSHRTYDRKFKTSSGEAISANVFYREKSGVHHVVFHIPWR